MVEDVVRALGYLTLGTRMKRLGERLQAQSQALLDDTDIGVPSAQFPALAALDRLGPLSIGDLTQALGVSQPGVTRTVGKLAAAGYVTLRQDPTDRRISVVGLTDAGRDLFEHSRRSVWPLVEAAVAEACARTSGPFLAQVAALEDALGETSLGQRAARIGRGGAAARMLDRPVWSTLNSHHAALSEGTALARRFLRDVNAFAAACDDSAPALAALAALVGPGEEVFIGQVPDIAVPPGLVAVKTAMGVQMVAGCDVGVIDGDEEVQVLTDADAPEMLALATLTEPGPFLPRTHVMGTFRGIRVAGRLAAMAGERMRFPGFTEVSGVCTHPDFRGRGYARRLSAIAAADIQSRGDTPFLHAWADNRAAIALYETLGFVHRADIHVAILSRPGPGATVPAG